MNAPPILPTKHAEHSTAIFTNKNKRKMKQHTPNDRPTPKPRPKNTITATRDELVQMFKQWNQDVLENPDDFKDESQITGDDSADEFIERLEKLQNNWTPKFNPTLDPTAPQQK